MVLNLNYSLLKIIYLILVSKKWMDMESIGFFYIFYIVYWFFYLVYILNIEYIFLEFVWRENLLFKI